MRVSIELDEIEIRNIIAAYLNNEYALNLTGEELYLETKSKQNYKSEWEMAEIRLNQQITRKD